MPCEYEIPGFEIYEEYVEAYEKSYPDFSKFFEYIIACFHRSLIFLYFSRI
jgi:hypothetical protein